MKKVVSVIAAAAMVASLAAVPSFAIARNPAGTCTVKHTIRKASPADVKKDGIIDPFEYDEIKFSYNTDLDGLTPIGTMSDGKTPIYDPMQVCPLMLGCQGNTLVNKVNKVIVAKEDFKVYASWDEVHGFNFAVVVNPTGINKVVQENEQPTDHEITMKDENGKEYTIMAPEDPFIGDGGLMFRVNGGLSRGDFSHSIAKRTNDGAYIDGHYGEHGKVSTPYVPVGETDVVVNYRADGYIVYEWSLPIDRILDAGQSTVGSTFEFATAFVHNDTRNMYSVSLGNRGYLTNSGGSDDWYKDAAMTFSSDRIREACTTHTWGDWGVITEPSCGVDGVETRTCSVCGEIETKTIPAEPHAWSDWEVTTPATCEEDGVATRVCSKCGENETKAITAPGHTEV
ncbi:MAG: hypothetical protein HFE30_08695, partial [Clostridiales bacterium]|nr:hypothetical protein [Clostridiales bacterium]